MGNEPGKVLNGGRQRSKTLSAVKTKKSKEKERPAIQPIIQTEQYVNNIIQNGKENEKSSSSSIPPSSSKENGLICTVDNTEGEKLNTTSIPDAIHAHDSKSVAIKSEPIMENHVPGHHVKNNNQKKKRELPHDLKAILYPKDWVKVETDSDELAFHHKSSSTSTLFLTSTLASPEKEELLECCSYNIHHIINPSSNRTKENTIGFEIFDETLYPLTGGKVDDVIPKPAVIHHFMGKVFQIGQLANEAVVMALAYIKRIHIQSNIVLFPRNWKRFLLSTMILASKVWEDAAVWNADFLDLFPKSSPKDLKKMEQRLLALLAFNVTIKASEYAKTYFEIRHHPEHDNSTSHHLYKDNGQVSKQVLERIESNSKSITQKKGSKNVRRINSTGNIESRSKGVLN